jgi:hypothetical protein
MLDLRLVQCVRDDCRRIVYFCGFCDCGQIYCSAECRDRTRTERRRESKLLYWRSFDGRWATARRVARLRQRRAQNVTDNGGRKVGPAAKVAAPAPAITTEVTPLAGKETTDGQHLDGHRAGANHDARDRDGGRERDDLEGPPGGRATASASHGDVAGGDCALAGPI